MCCPWNYNCRAIFSSVTSHDYHVSTLCLPASLSPMASVNQQEIDFPSDDYHFYLHAAQNASASTFSTTATAPNLPGPGRVIGLGYDALGNVLVDHIGRLRSRFRKGKQNESQALHSSEDLAQSLFPQDEEAGETLESSEKSASQESFSTNATAPNLPGTGRVLGLLYDALGNKLVNWMSKWAVKHGYSPEVVGEDVYGKMYVLRCNNRQKAKSDVVRIEDLSKSETLELRKACKRILKYAMWVLSTRTSGGISLA